MNRKVRLLKEAQRRGLRSVVLGSTVRKEWRPIVTNRDVEYVLTHFPSARFVNMKLGSDFSDARMGIRAWRPWHSLTLLSCTLQNVFVSMVDLLRMVSVSLIVWNVTRNIIRPNKTDGPDEPGYEPSLQTVLEGLEAQNVSVPNRSVLQLGGLFRRPGPQDRRAAAVVMLHQLERSLSRQPDATMVLFLPADRYHTLPAEQYNQPIPGFACTTRTRISIATQLQRTYTHSAHRDPPLYYWVLWLARMLDGAPRPPPPLADGPRSRDAICGSASTSPSLARRLLSGRNGSPSCVSRTSQKWRAWSSRSTYV